MQKGWHIFKELQKSVAVQPAAVAMVAKVSVILMDLVTKCLELLLGQGAVSPSSQGGVPVFVPCSAGTAERTVRKRGCKVGQARHAV